MYDLVPLAGGLDQVTPTLSLKPGVMRDAQNYECSITGGYTRIAGYERYDGRPAPSNATYLALTVSLTGLISVGDTITGVTSTATGYVIYSSGGTVLVTKVSGAFTVGEVLNVGGTARGAYIASGSLTRITPRLNATYLNLAAAAYRTDIGAVPGSGSILGVVNYNGVVYAWRNNSGGTAAEIYKATVSGWTAVALGEEVSFSNANTSVGEGDTLTQGGVTATVLRVVVQTGTLASGVNTGRLIISGRSGGNYAAGAATSTGGGSLTLSGAQAAITLLPNGSYEFDIGNFGGSGTKRVYGCDGVNRGFEFDGTVFVPLVTGMAVDTPNHVQVHKGHLFFSFGASVQFSGLGTQYVWSPVLGAGEIALPDSVTAFLRQPGDQTTAALAIYADSGTFVLYGTSSANFALQPYTDATGAKARSAQNLSSSYVFDSRGIVSLAAAQEYGNFDSAALSLSMRPYVQQRRTLVSASSINREKSQYRVFFSDGSGIYATIVNGKFIGAAPVLLPNPVLCACQGAGENGTETSYFGSSDGYVYRLDAGTSFDGAVIDAYMTLTWNSMKSPRMLKRFRKGSIEITGNSFAEIRFGYSLAYGSIDSGEELYETNSSSVYWDDFVWDNFYWDGRTLSPTETEVLGSGENIAVRIGCSSAEYEAFTVNSLIMHYSPRRGIR